MKNRTTLGSALLLSLAVGACAKDEAVADVKGSCGDAFKAQVCTYAKTKGTTLVETGAVIPIAYIENAPAGQPMAWPPVADAMIAMPEAIQKSSGFTQLTLYWEGDGHPPGAFMTPHFDFHFYTVPPSELATMDCKDVSKPAALPAGFVLMDIPLPPDMAKMTGVPSLIGLCVPGMGMHAILTAEAERKDAFDGSMVIGYYKGKPIFIEPMISKMMMMKKASFDLPIPDIPGLTGAHPTKFHAEYDTAANAYRFTFTGFTPAT